MKGQERAKDQEETKGRQEGKEKATQLEILGATDGEVEGRRSRGDQRGGSKEYEEEEEEAEEVKMVQRGQHQQRSRR